MDWIGLERIIHHRCTYVFLVSRSSSIGFSGSRQREIIITCNNVDMTLEILWYSKRLIHHPFKNQPLFSNVSSSVVSPTLGYQARKQALNNAFPPATRFLHAKKVILEKPENGKKRSKQSFDFICEKGNPAYEDKDEANRYTGVGRIQESRCCPRKPSETGSINNVY